MIDDDSESALNELRGQGYQLMEVPIDMKSILLQILIYRYEI